MRLGCIYITLMLGIIIPLSGQSNKSSKLSVGGGIGVNSSWLGGDISGGKDGFGFNAFLSGDYLINSFLKIQSSIQFVQIKNSNRQPLDMTNPDYFINNEISSSWIEIPITLSYSYIKKKRYSVFSSVGFSTAFLLKSQLTITTHTSSTLSATFDFRSQTNSFNILPRINSGLCIPFSDNQNFTISIYYQFGANDLYKETDQGSKLNVFGMDFLFNLELKK